MTLSHPIVLEIVAVGKALSIKSKGSIRAIDTIEDYRFAKKNFENYY